MLLLDMAAQLDRVSFYKEKKKTLHLPGIKKKGKLKRIM